MRRDREDRLGRAGRAFVDRLGNERWSERPVSPSGAMIERGQLLRLQSLLGNRVVSNLMAGGGGAMSPERALARVPRSAGPVSEERSPVDDAVGRGGVRISDTSDRFERAADANVRELTPLIARLMSGAAPLTPPNVERRTHITRAASMVTIQRGKKKKKSAEGEREKEKEHDTGPTVTTIGAHHPVEFEPPESAKYLVDPRWRAVFVEWLLSVGDWREVGLDPKLLELYMQLQLAGESEALDYGEFARKIIYSESDARALFTLLEITGRRLGQEGAALSVEDVRVLLERGGDGQKRAVFKFYDVLEARVRSAWGVFRMWARTAEGQSVLSKRELGSTQGGWVPGVTERRRR